MTDIVERLSQIANAKTGDPLPDFLSAPGAWGEPLSALARDAIAEIMRLRTTLEGIQSAMRISLDASLMVSNPSFADIRDGLNRKPGGYISTKQAE